MGVDGSDGGSAKSSKSLGHRWRTKSKTLTLPSLCAATTLTESCSNLQRQRRACWAAAMGVAVSAAAVAAVALGSDLAVERAARHRMTTVQPPLTLRRGMLWTIDAPCRKDRPAQLHERKPYGYGGYGIIMRRTGREAMTGLRAPFRQQVHR